MDGVSWQVVSLLIAIIVGLMSMVTALVVSRFKAQSVKTSNLTKLLHDINGANRERMSKNEARIEAVREVLETRITDSVEYYRHNIPELHEKERKLRAELAAHCVDDARGRKS